ncbi:Cu+ exporting ATPase, partial [Vibrio parahaemolyticus]
EVKTESSLKELVSSIESLGYQAGNHYELNLSGLSCGGCVKKLSSLLESNQDVISFEASTTHLEIRTLLSEQQVIDLIATLGYTANLDSVEVENESSPETEQVEKQSNIKDTQVPPASIQLQMLIQGMTCASCVSSVEKALTNVEGVEKAQVNLAEQSALVFAS